MSASRCLSFAAAVAVVLGTLCVPSVPQEAPGKTVLYFSCTKGFRHSTCAYAKPVITRMGEESGAFRVICSEDPRVIEDDFLADIDCIVFGNTTGSFLNDEQKAALLNYVRGGGGFVGIHAATDTHYDWPEYRDLVGGWFDGHPWNEQVTIKVEVPEHPACQPVDKPWVIADEIYQIRDWSRDDVCVLMSLDPDGTDFTKGGIKRGDLDFGVAWCKQFGQGRSFYTGLGHREEVFDNPMFQAHLLNGILWATAELEGPCEPHPRPE
ncbi:MAG: ThuA domain-containing protein [Armatimonadota bacterium]